jgi:hypothetical protein
MVLLSSGNRDDFESNVNKNLLYNKTINKHGTTPGSPPFFLAFFGEVKSVWFPSLFSWPGSLRSGSLQPDSQHV